jgi:P27 family predicted phage terminase small subunit
LASAEWTRLTTALAPILATSDASLLRLACESFAEWQGAAAILKTQGSTYTTRNKIGQQMHRVRPEVAIVRESRALYLRTLCELGATPIARTRTHPLPQQPQPDDEHSDLADLLG